MSEETEAAIEPPMCPICGKQARYPERLLATYYAPRKWWVLYHLIPMASDTVEFTADEPLMELSEDGRVRCSIPGFHIRCANAGYTLEEMPASEFQKRHK